jgi:AraC-like DNA-binding protein
MSTSIGKVAESGLEKRDKIEIETDYRRGILNPPPPAPEQFTLSRYKPASDLAHFIEYYWIVVWDLRGRGPHTQETLPQPNVHVVFAANDSRVYGVVTGKFSRHLHGKSHVFGIRFAPGMFRSFLGSAVSGLADKTRPVRAVFGESVSELEALLVSSAAQEHMVKATDEFFQRRIPAFDDKAELAKRVVQQVLDERDLCTVDDLVNRVGIGKRTLQRLFGEYVGVSPKWVIRRYRLHEAVERFRSGERPNFAQVALELGYFDQAHLVNDFKSIIGYSPTAFQKIL